MKKSLTRVLPSLRKGYDWKYCSIGGVTRVSIETGEDIAHLHELDGKLWTVLSCPVKGLEFDERTLSLMDTDADGKIRMHEVVEASQWLCRVLTRPSLLLDGKSELQLADINVENDDGHALRDMAQHVLERLGQSRLTISIDDLDAYRKVVDEQIKADAESQPAAALELPYGDHSDALLEVVSKLQKKIDDYFLRCRMIRYEAKSADVLDLSIEKLGSISQNNLASCTDELAAFPISQPNANMQLPLDKGVNPIWQADVDELRRLMALVEGSEPTTLDEKSWIALRDNVQAYGTAKAEAGQQRQKELEEALAEELNITRPIEKLLFLYRDFFRLLHNYVLMSDFYHPDYDAMFQAGKLYIDQRCCELCLRVDDIDKHSSMSGLSGMFMVYCTCTSKVKNETMTIVAVVTDGDINDLRVGKNAVFYDRSGLDWDATIVKIIDNPISIRQAFWSPYRKFGNWVTEKITKSASEKENKQFDEMTSKADEAVSNVTTTAEQDAAERAKQEKNKPQMFDIAKFAGIFAAIGLAFGAIGGALASLGGFVSAKWYNVILLVAFVVLVVSGPSMLLAWLKLRRRNLGPVLNANGWAVNARIIVNVRFGATLTAIARYPKLVLDDPYASKKTPTWRKWMWTVLILLVLIFGILWLNKCFPWQKSANPEQTELNEVPLEEPAVSDVADSTPETAEVVME